MELIERVSWVEWEIFELGDKLLINFLCVCRILLSILF